jgi:LmbE family N-acetylglucosaminyl deacetylase
LERTSLEQTRRTELQRATNHLGLKSPICLGLPDGRLCDHETGLADTLSALSAAFECLCQTALR